MKNSVDQQNKRQKLTPLPFRRRSATISQSPQTNNPNPHSFTSKKLYHLLERLFAWIEQHYVLGPLAYWGCVIVFSLLCVPESALTVGGGYIFTQAHGMWGGIALCASLVVVGGITGAFVAFLIARYLCFDTVRAGGFVFLCVFAFFVLSPRLAPLSRAGAAKCTRNNPPSSLSSHALLFPPNRCSAGPTGTASCAPSTAP
jgi:hypothetical protein